MTTKTPFLVYVLPIILSIGLGTLVMVEALDNSDRELNMWQIGGTGSFDKLNTDTIKTIGLESKYTVFEPIEFKIKLDDNIFDCGDLYITIYKISNSSKDIITQSGFLNQCYDIKYSYLPIDEDYSEKLNEAGEYEIFIEIYNKTYKQSSSLTVNLTVN